MDFYEQDTSREMGVQYVPKLKFEHINLTSYSKMRVDLAAQVCFKCSVYCMYNNCIILQVLSESVGKALEQTRGNEVSETVKFVLNMDKFFDCLNVNDYTTGHFKKKDYRNPYTSTDDFRLKVDLIHIATLLLLDFEIAFL